MPVPPRSLFAGLVDDAALFPPGSLPMARALTEHADHRRSPRADLIGPFLCPVSRVEELLDTLDRDEALSLSLVVDEIGGPMHSALGQVDADPRTTLTAIEAPRAALGEHAERIGANLAQHPSATGCLEVTRSAVAESLDLVDGSGWRVAKFRTGGTSAAAFPSEAELADFLVAATARRTPFKLTAGLHHAVRSTDGTTGFEQHGVLNVLVATRVASTGGTPEEVTAVLAERDPDVLTSFVAAWDDTTCAGVRASLRSFGCCGVDEPIDELARLGLIEERA
ncbi:MAG: hypothetical protein QOE01_1220 [Actinomycetota bacterium]|jgi:hypothetical protein|nr:hypothetical protein [Actinomycetota bacterium]